LIGRKSIRKTTQEEVLLHGVSICFTEEYGKVRVFVEVSYNRVDHKEHFFVDRPATFLVPLAEESECLKNCLAEVKRLKEKFVG
jgi:hypothetical protein